MTDRIFNDWLDKIIITENPSSEIIAYYFGLFETSSGFEIYLIGSNEFDEDDDDWACNADFEPKDKYLKLGQAGTDWEEILSETKQNIQNYIQKPTYKNSFLEKAKAIATGFDEGDLYRIK